MDRKELVPHLYVYVDNKTIYKYTKYFVYWYFSVFEVVEASLPPVKLMTCNCFDDLVKLLKRRFALLFLRAAAKPLDKVFLMPAGTETHNHRESKWAAIFKKINRN